jgi:hypothetical protein
MLRDIGWLSLFYLLTFSSTLVAQQDVVGFWKIMNDETGKVESLIAVYEYQGQY